MENNIVNLKKTDVVHINKKSYPLETMESDRRIPYTYIYDFIYSGNPQDHNLIIYALIY